MSEHRMLYQLRRLKPGLIWIRIESELAEQVQFRKEDYQKLVDAGYVFLITSPDMKITEVSDRELAMLGLVRVEKKRRRH